MSTLPLKDVCTETSLCGPVYLKATTPSCTCSMILQYLLCNWTLRADGVFVASRRCLVLLNVLLGWIISKASGKSAYAYPYWHLLSVTKSSHLLLRQLEQLQAMGLDQFVALDHRPAMDAHQRHSACEHWQRLSVWQYWRRCYRALYRVMGDKRVMADGDELCS